jgi:hypothetical protein
MRLRRKAVTAAVAAACGAPLAALAQSTPSAAQGELVVITITPVEQRVMDEQRRESLFRALDANGDGRISMAESGVNTQLLNAFQKLDRNADRSIERAEFARVHVDDGSRSAQRASGESSGAGQSSSAEQSSRSSTPPRYADEPWATHRPPRAAGQPSR